MKKILSLIGAVLIFAGVASAQYYTHDYKLEAPKIGLKGATTITGALTVTGALSFTGTATCGTGEFATTLTADTTTVTGATASSVFIVSGQYVGGVDQQDVLQWKAETDRLIVYRLASGESGAKYSWLKIK